MTLRFHLQSTARHKSLHVVVVDRQCFVVAQHGIVVFRLAEQIHSALNTFHVNNND